MRTSLISCVLILGLASTAGAREFRVLKGQQRDIAKFERAVFRSALHPQVKKRVLSTIARANRQRSTAVTQNLGQSLFRGNGHAGQLRQLVSQLEPMMTGSAPKGLKVTRSFNVRALNQAPPVTVENNPY